MSDETQVISKRASQDIDDVIDRILRDLGNPEPPLKLEDVRELLKLDLTYYSKTDLNLLDEMSHRVRLAGQTIINTTRRMKDVIEKVGLRALILPGERQIFIDNEVVQLKRRFIISHEISHDIIPWHQSILLGDNDETLSPKCYHTMEAEANYGGRQLLFMGERFQTESRDQGAFDWKTVQIFRKQYGNTLTTTLWQTVHSSDPASPTLGAISRHPKHPTIGGQRAGNDNVAYFFGSPSFQQQFSNISSEQIYTAITSYAGFRKKGPVGEGVFTLRDRNGDAFDFNFSSFSNSYDLLTHGTMIGPHKLVIGF